MFIRPFLLILLLSTVTGCASSRGFNRGELREEMNGKVTVTDADISKALSLKAQLPKPFKLGVFFKEQESRGHYGAPKWHWTDEDKNKVISLADQLKTSNEVSDVFAINDATISDTDTKSIRLAAAQHGADAVLVVSAINDVDSYVNGWAWTYIALVPALFVPASVSDSLFMARAAMWDVRNGFLYMTAESESMKKQTKPAAFADSRNMIAETKVEALDKLREEIDKMVRSLSVKKQIRP